MPWTYIGHLCDSYVFVISCDDRPHDSINRAAQDEIRHNGQDERNEKQLPRENRPVNLHLVNDIKNHREDKNSADRLPAFLHDLLARSRSREQGPEIRGLPGFCVFDAVDDRERDGHQRLDDKPKMKRSVQTSEKILDEYLQIFHDSSPPTSCNLPRPTAFNFHRDGPAQ